MGEVRPPEFRPACVAAGAPQAQEEVRAMEEEIREKRALVRELRAEAEKQKQTVQKVRGARRAPYHRTNRAAPSSPIGRPRTVPGSPGQS